MKTQASLSPVTAAMRFREGPFQSTQCGEFPSGPVVGTLCFHYWCRVDSLVGELRSYILHGAAKKKKKRERERERKR